jgi:hypothetical protein|eukprot:COSAG01_NODE_22287_length_862_cov_1.513761_1_plen_174_part_00
MASALAALVPAGVTVVPVPVPTPAGGLVRVQSLDGKIYFDSSYTRNTASCTLETKLRWKKTKEGPIPFGPKSPYKPPVPQSEMLAAMVSQLASDGLPLSGAFGEAELKAAIEAVPKEGAKAAAIAAATAALTKAAREVGAAALAEDSAACAVVEAKLAAEESGAAAEEGSCKT